MSPLATAKARRIEQSGSWTKQPLLWSSASSSCVWKAGGRCRSPNSCRRNRCSTLLPISGERALTPPALKPLIRTTGTPIPLFTFWNGGNTRAVRLTSRPTPTPSGTRSSGKRPLRSRRYSTTPIQRSLSRKSLTRCRRSASSATEGQNRKEQFILRHGLLC